MFHHEMSPLSSPCQLISALLHCCTPQQGISLPALDNRASVPPFSSARHLEAILDCHIRFFAGLSVMKLMLIPVAVFSSGTLLEAVFLEPRCSL